MMGDLTVHFSTYEFRCHGFGHRGHVHHATTVDPPLLVVLERIRSHVARPVPIVSGHRCAWWNRRVGGAARSRHLVTAAADIPRGLITVDEARELGVVGAGVSRGWVVHVDHRRGGFVTWRYD